MIRLAAFAFLLALWACQAEPAAPAEEGSNTNPVCTIPPPLRPIWTSLPPADGFDFPVGKPDARGYYDAQPFTQNNHLGEDWNGRGGGNSDLGDPVFAIADGFVSEAKDAGPGWGNIVFILHNAGTEYNANYLESLYAHLDSIWVKQGDRVKRGDTIGQIGNAEGAYWAHLHFELRREVDMPLGGGYSEDTTGFIAPTPFIQAHRPD